MEVNEGSDQKSDILSHWIAAHVSLKNEFTEDEKCHNLMAWLKSPFTYLHRYQLADNIDAQLKRMVQDLKEIIDHLNTSNSQQDGTDPVR